MGSPREVLDRPCGDTLIRLKDLPLEKRLAALTRALREAKTGREAQRMLEVVLDPQAAGGRIAT